ncbi:MAG TPA: hypothetical protein VFA91_02580 [Candidatus Polarisedimenticolia bacterium]|jgi:hypothetical protein|nr:hypothetical protein [Candidatus Polarisedimenticolia bacterium]
MSRALHLNATVPVVTALCAQHSVRISSIEPLSSGGTRVVLSTADDAENLRRKAKTQLIAGPVVRSALYVARQPIPYI